MRTMDQKRVLDDVVAWATDDPNVRLLLVTGSFARREHDDLSDLDIELFVRETDPLLEESAWYERFGRGLVTEALENPDRPPTRLVYYVDVRSTSWLPRCSRSPRACRTTVRTSCS